MAKLIDLTGMRFSYLTVLRPTEQRNRHTSNGYLKKAEAEREDKEWSK